MTLDHALARIRGLEQECQELRERLRFLEYQPTLAAGIRGETLVARAVNGLMTVFTATNDVTIDCSGITIEVKFSNLSLALKGAPTKRWTWARPLGHSHNKQFDRLVLVGEADSRFTRHYKDSAGPYIFFDLPRQAVGEVARRSGTHDIIQISTNPLTARTPISMLLYEKYQVSIDELQRRYGFVETAASAINVGAAGPLAARK